MVSGKVDGEILEGPRGTEGFGYDPVFFFPPLEKTFAELNAEEKNALAIEAKPSGGPGNPVKEFRLRRGRGNHRSRTRVMPARKKTKASEGQIVR